jgi:hypothetical protein
MATTDYALAQARASANLAPRLTIAEEVMKFVRTKPLGAGGAAIILAMMFVGALSEQPRRVHAGEEQLASALRQH